MILAITNRDDATTDVVEETIRKRNVPYLRFNTEDYPTKVAIEASLSGSEWRGVLLVDGRSVCLAQVHTVWYRRPVAPAISTDITVVEARYFAQRESEAVIAGFYELLAHAFWVSRPERIRAAEVKLKQLAVAAAFGFRVPKTLVTTDPTAARKFFDECNGHVVIKPLRCGRIEYPNGSVELIYTNPLEQADLEHSEQVKYAPCLLQEYVPKQYEVRATIMGERLFAVALDSQSSEVSRHDWRRDNSSGVRYSVTELPPEVASRCRAFVNAYGLAFSAMDLVCTPEGHFVFLENNPNGQWAWLDLELDLGMVDAMVDLLARGRAHGNPRPT